MVPIPIALSLSFPPQSPVLTQVSPSPLEASLFHRIHCKTEMPPREMEIPESALDIAVSVHGPFPNPHSRLQRAAKFRTIFQESSLLVSHVDLSRSFLPLKNNPTFHVHSAKLYLTCNLKTKPYSSKWDQTGGHFI